MPPEINRGDVRLAFTRARDRLATQQPGDDDVWSANMRLITSDLFDYDEAESEMRRLAGGYLAAIQQGTIPGPDAVMAVGYTAHIAGVLMERARWQDYMTERRDEG